MFRCIASKRLGWLGREMVVLAFLPALSVIPIPALAQDAPAPVAPQPIDAPEQPAEVPTAVPDAPTVVPVADRSPVAAAELAPRFELRIPSVKRMLSEAKRSQAGGLLVHLTQMALAQTQQNVKTLDGVELATVGERLAQWPDTSIAASVFAPDVQGRARWALAVDWPLAKSREAVEAALAAAELKNAIEGLSVRPGDGESLVIRIADQLVAYLIPSGDAVTVLASHMDLPTPKGKPATGVSDPATDLVSCRLDLSSTEKDSGATFLSSFSFLSGVEYVGNVGESGQWEETVKVLWPPISGVGAKALFDRVKQTFFVPDEAFGALVANVTIIPGILESMAGLGPQMVMEAPGEMTMIGEPGLGPIASRVEPEFCLTLLPGTGFIPAPDLVIQTRARDAYALMNHLQSAAQKLNEQFIEKDQSPPWHEMQVLDQTVLWNEGSHYPGAIMPFVMRPVLFVTEEKDAKDRERSFLVLAWTTTSPRQLVERWLRFPRNDKRELLPTKSKTDGQLWVNWERAYERLSPYANVTLGAVSEGQLLPPFEQVKAQLTHGLVTADLGYAGLTVSHAGPLPLGVMVVLPMATVAAAPDESGGSDLARERLATQRLEVLYHHAKLFKKDIGRWPAEVAELDGYVDFSGNPELLQLDLSSSKRWRDWLGEMFEPEEKEEEVEEEVEDLTKDINDRLYVIDWGKEQWRLGLAPATLEHLEKLYIDQDGEIHRIEKNGTDANQKARPSTGTDQVSETKPADLDSTIERIAAQAAENIAKQYGGK